MMKISDFLRLLKSSKDCYSSLSLLPPPSSWKGSFHCFILNSSPVCWLSTPPYVEISMYHVGGGWSFQVRIFFTIFHWSSLEYAHHICSWKNLSFPLLTEGNSKGKVRQIVFEGECESSWNGLFCGAKLPFYASFSPFTLLCILIISLTVAFFPLNPGRRKLRRRRRNRSESSGWLLSFYFVFPIDVCLFFDVLEIFYLLNSRSVFVEEKVQK